MSPHRRLVNILVIITLTIVYSVMIGISPDAARTGMLFYIGIVVTLFALDYWGKKTYDR